SKLQAAAPTGVGTATYSLPSIAGGASANICLDTGNCAGVGGGVTTGGGTTNTLAMFTGSKTIGDSILTQNGSTISLAGTFSATTLTGNGSGVTNLNGSNVGSGTVANARLINSGALTVTAGTNLTGGGSVALGSSVTLNVSNSPSFSGSVTLGV